MENNKRFIIILSSTILAILIFFTVFKFIIPKISYRKALKDLKTNTTSYLKKSDISEDSVKFLTNENSGQLLIKLIFYDANELLRTKDSIERYFKLLKYDIKTKEVKDISISIYKKNIALADFVLVMQKDKPKTKPKIEEKKQAKPKITKKPISTRKKINYAQKPLKKSFIALVINDVGEDLEKLNQFLDLGIKLNFAVLPYKENSAESVSRIKEKGFEYILSQPMEPIKYPEIDPGEHALFLTKKTYEVVEITVEVEKTSETKEASMKNMKKESNNAFLNEEEEEEDPFADEEEEEEDLFADEEEEEEDLFADEEEEEEDLFAEEEEEEEEEETKSKNKYFFNKQTGKYEKTPVSEPTKKVETVKKTVSQKKLKTTASIFLENIKNIGKTAGVNNNMGSAFTENKNKMTEFLKIVKTNNMFFLDSKTTTKSVGEKIARKLGVKYAKNNMFLDSEDNYNKIYKNLHKAIKLSKRRNKIIIMGHMKSNNLLRALKKILPEFKKSKVELVLLKEVMK